MKRVSIKAFIVAAAMAVVGLGSHKLYRTYVASNLSDNDLFVIENIEALANDEVKIGVRERRETTSDNKIAIYDNKGKYIGDSIIGYNHVVICVGAGVTPCTPGGDTHMFGDPDYKCTIGK